MFDYSSYLKNFRIIIYFVCDLLYYQKYFKYDLSFFFIFALIFQIKRMFKRCKKNSKRHLLWDGGSIA